MYICTLYLHDIFIQCGYICDIQRRGVDFMVSAMGSDGLAAELLEAHTHNTHTHARTRTHTRHARTHVREGVCACVCLRGWVGAWVGGRVCVRACERTDKFLRRRRSRNERSFLRSRNERSFLRSRNEGSFLRSRNVLANLLTRKVSHSLWRFFLPNSGKFARPFWLSF